MFNKFVYYQFGWSKETRPGQFTGSTGAHILTPRELASGTQAWAKKVMYLYTYLYNIII